MIQRLEPRRILAADVLPAFHFNAGGDWVHEASGRSFQPADAFFDGGTDVSVPATTPVYLAPDQFALDSDVLRTARVGASMTFAASVSTGRYAMWLEFAELDTTVAAGANRFDVFAEGVRIADDVDVVARAGAPFTATAISLDVAISDGQLDLSFVAEAGRASVNAIVLLPLDTPASLKPYGAESLADSVRPVYSASNLQQIGQALALSADTHRGRYPASLSVLPIHGFAEHVGIFINPRGDTLRPRGELSVLERSAWIAQTTDYLYIPGQRNSMPAENPLAYENPDKVAGEVAVLFGDLHVELLPRAEAAALLGFDATRSPSSARPPALGIPRDADVVSSANRVNRITQAIYDAAAENRNRIPASIGLLVSAGHITDITVFANPRLGHVVPASILAGTDDEKAAWVNANSDYVLLGAGQSLSRVHTMLYERPDASLEPVGLHVAAVGAAVELLDARWAYEAIARDGGPLVQSAVFDATARQPTLRIRFSEYVGDSLSPADLVFTTAANTVVPTPGASLEYDSLSRTATFVFDGEAFLPDGRYHATLAAGSVSDVTAKPLAQPSSTPVALLAGDTDGDLDVDFDDLLNLARHFGSTQRTAGQGNVTYDAAGRVDFNDLLVLARQFGKQLPAAPSASATVPANTAAGTRRRSTLSVLT